MLLHCNGKTKEKVKNLVCDFDYPDDAREMERLTRGLNLQDIDLKIIKKKTITPTRA